jgi:hypothetical protein
MKEHGMSSKGGQRGRAPSCCGLTAASQESAGKV